MTKKRYWLNRWKTLAKEVRYVFIISLCLVILIDLIFSFFPAFNDFSYRLGQFVLKLSYAFTTASIFYFVVQHYPKEKKRIKLHSLLSYKIHDIQTQINLLIQNLLGKDEFKTIEEISWIRCSNLLAKLAINKRVTFDNTFGSGTDTIENYFKIVLKSILGYCDEVLGYNEYVDTEVVNRISKIKSICENIINLNIYQHGDNLRKYAHDFYIIIQHKIELDIAIQKYSQYYYLESRAFTDFKHKIKEGEELEGDDIQNEI